MKIGWVGLGKLGLPIVQTLAKYHAVKGYDIEHRTEGQSSWTEVCEDVDLIFIAVQTPHAPEYEGITDMPEETAPFDLSYLLKAVLAVDAIANPSIPIVIVSTVLPGDIRRDILPLVGDRPVLYNPAFIAMGTVKEDFLNPEFVLIGYDNENLEAAALLKEFYLAMIPWARFCLMSIESAELTKVAYNTFISQKIVFANTMMEICDKVGGNVNDVLHALHLGNKRILSPKYLSAGMGDGGPCHPRDNIAMAHIARELGLSADPFSFVVHAREDQSRSLAVTICAHNGIRPIVLLGRAYKRGVDIETGSAGLLLEHHLKEMGKAPVWDDFSTPGTFVLCLPDNREDYPPGSIIIDPWGEQMDVPGCIVNRIGRHLGR